MAVMSCLSNVLTIVSSSTGGPPPPSCTMARIMEITTLLVGAATDTLLSFDSLLIFLISNIALTLFASPLLTVALGSTITVAALALYRTYVAYYSFMALAPGGLPSSFDGFMKAVRITRDGPTSSGHGFLQTLSLRQGSTPYTMGTTVHHQIKQQSPEDVQQYFADRLVLFATLQSASSHSISTKQNATSPGAAGPSSCPLGPLLRTFECSVYRPERNSYGAHVILHPSDLEQVVQMGWGEVHPLANTRSPFAKLSLKPCLPGTLALIYAPREYDEVCIVMRIIEAGAKHLANIDKSSR